LLSLVGLFIVAYLGFSVSAPSVANGSQPKLNQRLTKLKPASQNQNRIKTAAKLKRF